MLRGHFRPSLSTFVDSARTCRRTANGSLEREPPQRTTGATGGSPAAAVGSRHHRLHRIQAPGPKLVSGSWPQLRRRSPRPSRRLSNSYPKRNAPVFRRRPATSPKLSWRSSSLTSDGARCTTTSVHHQVVTDRSSDAHAQHGQGRCHRGQGNAPTGSLASPGAGPMNQMTTQWLDKFGNAGMIATELQAAMSTASSRWFSSHVAN
jgi:hypothetical protein